MSPLRLGFAVAGLTALLWTMGALRAPHPLSWTALDLRWYFFPLYEAFYGALRAGAPMFWNPYQLCGMPVVGTLQAGFFYPPHILYLLLPTAWALATSTAFHVAFAAGTGAAFARRAGLSPAAATLAGTVFATTGPLRHWQFWPYLLEASAWIPLGAIGILDLTGDRRARGALLLALSSGMSCLAGGPQATAFGGYVWAGLLVARLVFSGPARGAIVRACFATVAALLAGGLLGAIALLPAFELAEEGLRNTQTLSPEFLYPMGIPTPLDTVKMWVSTEPSVMLPAAVLLPFALAGGLRWPLAWGLVVGGVAVVLSLGPALPTFRLYHALPLIGWFREPSRLLLIGGLCLGILAGLGLDALTRFVRVRGLALIVVTAILAAQTYQGVRAPRPVTPLPYREQDVPWTPAHRDAYVRLARMAGHDRVWTFSPSIFAGALPPKLPTLTGLRSIEDYEPLALRRQSEFFVYFVEGATMFWQLSKSFEGRMNSLKVPRGRELPATRRRLLDLTATRFLVMPPPARRRPEMETFIRDAGLKPRPPLSPEIELIENPHAIPRAYVTYRARRAPPSRQLLALMARETFDPLVESWIEADADLAPAPAAPARGVAATIVRDDPGVVEIEATLEAPGLVVLADTYAKGWIARVDGAPAPLYAANHLFRGVPAPAGAHRVRFEYRPRSLRIGAALTLASALGLALLGWRVLTRAA